MTKCFSGEKSSDVVLNLKTAMKAKSREELEKSAIRRAKGEDTLASAADLLQRLIAGANSPLAPGFQRLRLEQNWTQVIGARWAQQTRPAHFEKGILEVWVIHPSLSVELRFIADELRSSVNRFLKSESACTEVRFTTHSRNSIRPPAAGGP